MATTAIADITIGVGIGTLYNGIGLNFGDSSSTGLTFGALGCISIWSARSESGNRTGTNFNCGVGLGYINTAVLTGNRHGLGIAMALNYNTDEDSPARDGTPAGEGIVLSLTPSYNFFFKGVERRGINLGFGPRINFRDSGYVKTYWLFNLGYQF